VFDVTRLGIAVSTSRGSDLNDPNHDGRKRQDSTDCPEDDGDRECVQSVGRGSRAGSSSMCVGSVGRANGRPEVPAKHTGEVK